MQGGMIFFTKKEGKSRAGLRMSKKCCNFAPDFGLAADTRLTLRLKKHKNIYYEEDHVPVCAAERDDLSQL